MSGLGPVVRAGVRRRRLTTVAVGLAVLMAVTAAVLVVTARIAHAEPDFPHHPPVACLALLGVVLTVVLAERSLGSVRTLLIGVLWSG